MLWKYSRRELKAPFLNLPTYHTQPTYLSQLFCSCSDLLEKEENFRVDEKNMEN